MTAVTTAAGATTTEMTGERSRRRWIDACGFDDLVAERGACALVDGHQVALFRLVDGTVYAVGNHDPFSGANVIARGLVGSKGDVPKVASPMYKQSFDLRTGECLDVASASLPVYPVRVREGRVEIAVP